MPEHPAFQFGQLSAWRGAPGELFALSHPELEDDLRVGGPVFEIDGALCGGFVLGGVAGRRELDSGGQEMTLEYSCPAQAGISLQVVTRSFTGSPVLRFKYILSARETVHLTKSQGRDRIEYFSLQQPGFTGFGMAEYQLSHFDPLQHAYMPNREDRAPEEVLPGLAFVGPVALFHTAGRTLLAAYEHGADHPLSFFDFHVQGEAEERSVALRARQGNYYAGQSIAPGQPWSSAWFQLALHPGGMSAFLPVYRRFFLEEVCENRESRKPYIYYNTWNYQERQKYFHGRPYLESMHAGRMLAEIEVASRLGVDVFVIDTGWYGKTGDWLPNLQRFPEGLWEVKRKLDECGMKLGLWFNPTVAALTSGVYTRHPEWEMEWEGKPRWRGPIWETEESTGMCLASDYADEYIEIMVRLNRDLGVTYFKWDAVSQYGCDSAHHNHGTADNTPEERADCYAYSMGLAMIRIVEEVTRRCPGTIVDFDITEGGRFVGLGFLSAGKFFLVNNGPYFSDFNIPRQVKMEPDTINVFFYPGAARPRICRQGIKYDELIPSILFLTHYLTDGPLQSQQNSLAALMLGGNGLWGDLLDLSEDDIEFHSESLALYKMVGESVTRAFPHRHGFAGSSPEIYEKVSPEECSGIVVFFTVAPGTFTCYTQPLDLDLLGEVIGADGCESADGNRLKLTVTLERDGARVVYLLPRKKKE